jgi:hypothetical protein
MCTTHSRFLLSSMTWQRTGTESLFVLSCSRYFSFVPLCNKANAAPHTPPLPIHLRFSFFNRANVLPPPLSRGVDNETSFAISQDKATKEKRFKRHLFLVTDLYSSLVCCYGWASVGTYLICKKVWSSPIWLISLRIITHTVFRVNVKQTLQEYRKEHILDLNHKNFNSSL